MSTMQHLADYGLTMGSGDGATADVQADFPKVIERSRGVANKMNKGVGFLMKKNKIDVLFGHATLKGDSKIDIQPSENMDGEKIGEAREVQAEHIIVATGARAREIPPLSRGRREGDHLPRGDAAKGSAQAARHRRRGGPSGSSSLISTTTWAPR